MLVQARNMNREVLAQLPEFSTHSNKLKSFPNSKKVWGQLIAPTGNVER